MPTPGQTMSMAEKVERVVLKRALRSVQEETSVCWKRARDLWLSTRVWASGRRERSAKTTLAPC
jgi:hypothetical protein